MLDEPVMNNWYLIFGTSIFIVILLVILAVYLHERWARRKNRKQRVDKKHFKQFLDKESIMAEVERFLDQSNPVVNRTLVTSFKKYRRRKLQEYSSAEVVMEDFLINVQQWLEYESVIKSEMFELCMKTLPNEIVKLTESERTSLHAALIKSPVVFQQELEKLLTTKVDDKDTILSLFDDMSKSIKQIGVKSNVGQKEVESTAQGAEK
jgi:hypothetical protein